MLGYRKRTFRRAHSLLRAIEQDRTDLVSLKNLQLLLIDEIMRAERRVRELKSKARKMATSASAKRLKAIEKRIVAAQTLIFIWKCFGDGIAFIYLDKYALKHTFLSATNSNPKQTSGFLLDKSGIKAEWALLESAIFHGVPAVLADLTNTIRHGDVCLLGGDDPYLLEVKTSKSRNSRAKRQKHDLEILGEFYESNHSNRLRGMRSVYREELAFEEVSYGHKLNDAIRQCLVDDVGIARPEPGLVYIALRTAAAKVQEAFSSIGIEKPWIFSLNGAKNDRDWAPYYPFTLTIRDVDHLWAFVRGDIFLLVLVDPRQLEAICARSGNVAKFDPAEESYPLTVRFSDGGTMGIASQALARIGMECVSPKWMIANSLVSFQVAMDRAKIELSNYILPEDDCV